MERSQFTFYASFAEAADLIKKKTDRCDFYDVLKDYALYGKEPDLLQTPDVVAVAFKLIKPTLDASVRKAEGGKKKASKEDAGKMAKRCKEDTGKIPGRYEEDTSKLPEETGNEKENEKENEYENECCYPPTPLTGGSKAVKYYLDRINATPSRTCIDELLGYEKTLGTEICLKAMDVALDDKKTAWSYIRAILQDKAARGIRTLADWQADEDKRRADKAIVNPKTAGSTPGHAPAPERDERAKASMERLRKQLREEAGT